MPVTINAPGAAGTVAAPTIPNPSLPADAAAQVPAPGEAPPIILPAHPSLAVHISSDRGGHVQMPHIHQHRPKIAGQEPIDRGDAAEFVVIHGQVGHLYAGSTVTKEDLGANANVAWLLRKGAIARLKPEAPAAPAAAPASDATDSTDASDPTPPKGKGK